MVLFACDTSLGSAYNVSVAMDAARVRRQIAIRANCGEEYVSAETTELLLRTAEEAVRSGVRVSVRDYVAA